MAANFHRALPITLKWEGGYVDHPKDPGGATNRGITIATLAAWRKRPVTKADVRALTEEEAAQIYRANYWNAVGADGMPPGADLCAFDEGVTSGPSRGRKRYLAAMGRTDIVKAMCDGRRSFLRGLKTFSTFGRGWISRVANIEAHATKWALAAAGRTPTQANRELATASSKASTQAANKAKGAATAGTTAGGAGGGAVADQTATQAITWSWEAALFFGVVVLVAGGFALILWHGSRVDRERAKAFAEVANGPV